MINIISKPVTIPRIVDVYKNRITFTGGVYGDSVFTIRDMVTNGTDNPKTAKIDSDEFIVKCISMLPAKLGGVGNLCPHADACADTCLNFTGRGTLASTHYARLARTLAFQMAREWSIERIRYQLSNSQKLSDRKGKTLICRPNMLTDYPFEKTGLIDEFSRCQWYDYSKNPKRFGAIRPNYWVTFSRGSDNDKHVENVLEAGGNVAMVFHNNNGKCGWRAHDQTLPDLITVNGKQYPIIDGGKTDYRPADPRSIALGGEWSTGCVVGLRLLAFTREKRKAAIDSGFSIPWNG